MTKPLDIQLPEKMAFFAASKSRYKVAYGGRGAGKSWAIADCLIINAVRKPCRILCTRELQNSIKDSVYRLISDRIKFHELDNFFEITENEIRGKNGSLFLFKGLRSNINEIKSLEGVNYCWVEEANKVSNDSWEILTPTIREPESEIWITFNTGAITDPVYERFVATNREDTICTKINFYDNPWFPDVLRLEMLYDKTNNPDRYAHVWLGEPGYEGKFFVEFNEQLAEEPFHIPLSTSMGRLIGSLDSGTAHATSFGLWYVDDNLDAHRLLSYRGQGVSIRANAEEIFDRLESFPYTYGAFPDVIVYDNQMDTGARLNDNDDRAPIDEYQTVFKRSNKIIRWEQANKRKENGCQILKMFFRGTSEMKPLRYWTGYNQTFVDGIQRVTTDPNNAEIYLKADGDDEADEARYGAVKVFTVRGTLTARRMHAQPKTHMEKLLAGQFAKKHTVEMDWYNL